MPAAREILSCPLPDLGLGDRLLLRAIGLLARCHIVSIHGLQHIGPACDPFILVANHGTHRESLLVPALLLLQRGGLRLHFLADWNFRLIPGVGLIYSRAQTVTVPGKSAKPRALNIFMPLYRRALRPFEQARAHLLADRSIGIFPPAMLDDTRVEAVPITDEVGHTAALEVLGAIYQDEKGWVSDAGQQFPAADLERIDVAWFLVRVDGRPASR